VKTRRDFLNEQELFMTESEKKMIFPSARPHWRLSGSRIFAAKVSSHSSNDKPTSCRKTAKFTSVVMTSSTSQTSDSFYHRPVLCQEVSAILSCAAGGTVIDCTLGGGGHTAALLDAGMNVIAFDQDADAIGFCEKRFAEMIRAGRLRLIQGNFRNLVDLLRGEDCSDVVGVLADLGVSSWQLDTAERGFSFRNDAPLDMRMNRHAVLSADEIVNDSEEAELVRIFFEYGEESAARRIARKIVQARQEARIERTVQLAELIEQVVPRRGKRHPATKVFQALRIAVNDELGSLQRLLTDVPALLAPGANFAVITFHSLEDRLVKRAFRSGSQKWLDRPEWPAPRLNPGCVFAQLTRKPLIAASEETEENPRARSAKLRAVTIIDHAQKP